VASRPAPSTTASTSATIADENSAQVNRLPAPQHLHRPARRALATSTASKATSSAALWP
jgi:hypothetical protein